MQDCSLRYKNLVIERRSRQILFALAAALLAAPALPAHANAGTPRAPRASVSPGAKGIRFVSSEPCGECHPKQAARWAGSHHDLAMQPATEKSVLGNFDDASFTRWGVTTRFFRRGDAFMVRTQGGDGELTDFEVAYTFGAEPLQQYLIPFPGGRLQALSIAWDTVRGRWFDLYPDENVEAADPLHWTGRYQRWNSMCAECHSTNLEKHYDAASDTYRTTWSEIDIGCEACHGPGAAHTSWARAQQKRGEDPASHDGLVVHFDPQQSHLEIEACARCHARRHRISAEDRHGRPLLDDYAPELLRAGLYQADGRIQGEVYVYGSFLQSAMYREGVRCSDCHDPHALTLRASGNTLCTRCHGNAPDPRFPTLRSSTYDDPAHHHHPQGSEGARCIACHMPERTYMVVDPRHDHSFRVPRPDLALAFGTPSVCSHCHDDPGTEPTLSASGALRVVSGWKGWKNGKARRAEHFSSALMSARSGERDTQRKLARLAGDRTRPGIVRATALEMLRNQGVLQREGRKALLLALEDRDPLVRAAAASEIDGLPPDTRLKLGLPLLDDPIRAVRTGAARGLASLPDEAFDPAERKLFEGALAEHEAALSADADLPSANLNFAILHEKRGQRERAIADYETALRLDPRFLPASVNLANLLNRLGRNSEAERALRRAIVFSPREGELHYSLALLTAEMNRPEEALEELRVAAELLPDRARVRYNYALALARLSREGAARRELEEALLLDPEDPDILYALAIQSLKSGDLQRALSISAALLDLVPGDLRARQLRRKIEEESRIPRIP